MSDVYSRGCGPQKLGTPFKLAPMMAMAVKAIAPIVAKKVMDKASGGPTFKGANSSNSECWKGKVKVGTKPSPTRPGVTVNDCVDPSSPRAKNK